MMDAGKPGSSRLLRRQFSLDKDDLSMQKHSNLETISSMVDSTKLKASYQPLLTSSSLPGCSGSNLLATKMHKIHSASVAQDLEKIEEIPISPSNTLHELNNSVHSFKNSNSNNNLKTPPNCEDAKEINMNIV